MQHYSNQNKALISQDREGEQDQRSKQRMTIRTKHKEERWHEYF